ncbi:hypothetical protein OG984_06430 [Nocardioides sp. NBC_00368]
MTIAIQIIVFVILTQISALLGQYLVRAYSEQPEQQEPERVRVKGFGR